MFMRDQHPRSVQILGVATLKRDPNALTALTAIRSTNPRFEKIDNYNKPLFKIIILLILKSFLDRVLLARDFVIDGRRSLIWDVRLGD